MSKKVCLVILLGLILFSCGEGSEEPVIEEKKDFKVNVTPNAFQGGLSIWVVLNDSEGKVINYQQVSNEQTYSLEIPELERVSLSVLSVASSSQGQNFKIQSYQMIKSEDEVTLGLRPSGYSTPQKGVPIQIQVNFSEQGGWAVLSHSSGETSNKLFTQQYLNENVVNLQISPVIGEPEYLLMAENTNGEKRSAVISLDENSNGLQFDFENLNLVARDMISFSEVLSSDFKLLDFSIYEAVAVNNSWYRNGAVWDSKNLNPNQQSEAGNLIIPIEGILHRAEFIYQNPAVPSINLFYSGVGNSLEFPLPSKGDFSVQNKRFDSFQFSKLPSASDWKISFSRPSTSNQPPYQSISAEIFGNGTGFKLTLPDELLTLYPFLVELNSLEANSIDQYFRSGTYDDLIHRRLVEFSELEAGFVLEVKKGL